jgi:hypothetical protein
MDVVTVISAESDKNADKETNDQLISDSILAAKKQLLTGLQSGEVASSKLAPEGCVLMPATPDTLVDFVIETDEIEDGPWESETKKVGVPTTLKVVIVTPSVIEFLFSNFFNAQDFFTIKLFSVILLK